jgi:hypothetical protein
MPSKTTIFGIITLAFVVFVAMDMLGIWRYAIVLDEPSIRDMVTERYPGADPSMDYMEECVVCDPSGSCYVHWRPCWNISFLVEGDEGVDMVDMLVDEGGDVIEEEVKPCVGWWCEATPCRYTYSEQSGGSSFEYINEDCQLPEISCDPYYGRCRECQTPDDCLGMVTEATPGLATYTFDVLGTGEYGIIDNQDLLCNITFEGDILFSNTTDIETCRLIVSSFARCVGGVCDFVPEFALIPF